MEQEPISIRVAKAKGCSPSQLYARPGYPADHCYCDGMETGHVPQPDTFGLIDWLTPAGSYELLAEMVEAELMPSQSRCRARYLPGEGYGYQVGLHGVGGMNESAYVGASLPEAIAMAWLAWKAAQE